MWTVCRPLLHHPYHRICARQRLPASPFQGGLADRVRQTPLPRLLRGGQRDHHGHGFAVLVGAVIGIPGATYLTALHNLVTGKSSTAIQARRLE